MTSSSRLKNLNVLHVTKNQPFCAGVILLHQKRLILTLNTDGLPASLSGGQAWRVGGVSGGQESGETIWECAIRDARGELSCEIQLLPSPITYFHDIDTGEIEPISCPDAPAPFLLERQSNFFPYRPYRPGLPFSPYTYFGSFLAEQVNLTMPLAPGNDLAGLLFIQLEQWAMLLQQPTLESALQQGAQLHEQQPLTRQGRLWISPNEAFRTVIPLLQKHPEVLSR